MSIKTRLFEMLNEFARSKRRGPFDKRIFQCSECFKMVRSYSIPSKRGCPKGKHKWADMKVRL